MTITMGFEFIIIVLPLLVWMFFEIRRSKTKINNFTDFKNFLLLLESKLLKKMMSGPKTPPQSAWSYFRFLNIALFLIMISFIPLLGMFSIILYLIGFNGYPVVALMILIFISSVYLMMELDNFRCPRCKMPFFKSGFIMRSKLRDSCLHCGLPIGSEPEGPEWAPDTKSSHKRPRLINLDQLLQRGFRGAVILWFFFLIYFSMLTQ